MIFEALIASICISLISLVGVFFFGNKGYMTGTHRFILPASVGIFLGIIFFELIPETFAMSPDFGAFAILGGFLGFYLFSNILDTYHHHHFDHADLCGSNGAQKLLVGDAIHNFSDGIIIATAFIVDPTVGIITTIGIALHEIPQEIAEFSVLMHSGCTRSKATLYNFLSATTIIIGTAVTYIFSEFFGTYLFVLIGIAAGNLLYIATADLLPELQKNHNHHFIQTFCATIGGVLLIVGLLFISDAFAHGLSVAY